MSTLAVPLAAVLFDLDGTLVDNMPFHVEAWIETARDLGVALTADRVLHEFSGRRNDEILPRLLGRPVSADEVAALGAAKEARYRRAYAPHLALLPGADALLTALAARGIPCAIASAAPPENRAFVVEGLGLGARMQAVVGAEEVAHGKPAPDLFLEAARRLGAAPARTLVVEDARLGVQAGRAAGMPVLGITTSEPASELLKAGALASAPDFRALPAEILALIG